MFILFLFASGESYGLTFYFSISLITIMGLIGEQCGPCAAAAAADDGHGGGLAGRWWRGWAKVSFSGALIHRTV